MKKLWILCLASGLLYACGDNNVGNRTYDTKTVSDSANYPIGGGGSDTTPTSNNNAYNPDSTGGRSTPLHNSNDSTMPLPPLQQ